MTAKPAAQSPATPLAARIDADAERMVERYLGGETWLQVLDLPAGTCAALYRAAYGHLSVGRAARAETAFRCLCVLEPDDPKHLVGHGLCLMRRGSHKVADAYFRQACHLAPDWAVPYFHRCAIAMTERRWNPAEAALESFFAFADDATPPEMTAEAQRMRVVVEEARSTAKPAETAG